MSAMRAADYCFLDQAKTSVARDALQNFALLSGRDDKTRGHILRASKALSRLFNYNFDSPQPQDLSVFWGKRTEKDVIKAIDACIANRTSFSGNVHCYKSGCKKQKPMWCEFNIGPVPKQADDPGVVCFALFVRSIDNLEKSRDNMKSRDLVEDHAKQSMVTRTALHCTAIIERMGDGTRHFQYGKQGEGGGFAEMTGYARGELAGEPISRLYGTDTKGSDRRVLNRALLDHDPLSCDMICHKKDGSPFWRHCLAVPIQDGAYLTFNLDVTRLRRYVGQYMIGGSIGKGSFGTVKLGMHKKTGKQVAIKRVKTEGNSRVSRLIKNEIAIQRQLASDYIAQLLEVIKLKGMTYMIMDLVPDGSLFERVVSKGGVTEADAIHIFMQIAQCVEWCHDNGVCHRDLKPENLLMFENGNMKLIDFGLSAFYKPGQTLRDICGSRRFQAPEMMKKTSRGYDPEAVDVWSMGVVLFEVFHGQIRLSQSDAESTAQYIRNYFDQFDYSAEGEEAQPEGQPSLALRHIMMRMLDPNPTTRIKIAELFDHDWLREVADMYDDEREDRLSTAAMAVNERLSKLETSMIESEVSEDSMPSGSSSHGGSSMSAGGEHSMVSATGSMCSSSCSSSSSGGTGGGAPPLLNSPSGKKASFIGSQVPAGSAMATPASPSRSRPGVGSQERIQAMGSPGKKASSSSLALPAIVCESPNKAGRETNLQLGPKLDTKKAVLRQGKRGMRSDAVDINSALGSAVPGSTWDTCGSEFDSHAGTRGLAQGFRGALPELDDCLAEEEGDEEHGGLHPDDDLGEEIGPC